MKSGALLLLLSLASFAADAAFYFVREGQVAFVRPDYRVEEGAGSSFEVTLPYRPGEPASDMRPGAEPREQRRAA